MSIKFDDNLVNSILNKEKKRRLSAAGFVAKNEAKSRTPIDTSTLKNSIGFEIIIKNDKVRIGTNVEYATYVEYGTRRQKAAAMFRKTVDYLISSKVIENL